MAIKIGLVTSTGQVTVQRSTGAISNYASSNLKYDIKDTTVNFYQIQPYLWIGAEVVTNLEDASGSTIGTEAQVRTYLDAFIAVIGGGGGGGGEASAANQVLEIAELEKLTGANQPSQQELLNPVSVVISSYKKLSFICTGAISVTLDSNTIVYPQNLGGGSTLHGTTFEADDVSLNAATFNGTGKVFLTIKQ